MSRASTSVFVTALACVFGAGAGFPEVEVWPPRVELDDLAARQQLLVATVSVDRPVDATRRARYRSLDPAVAVVDASGVVRPLARGTTAIEIEIDGLGAGPGHDGSGAVATTDRVQVAVEVTAGDERAPVTFERDVQPILARGACSTGPCHGKQRGQNGFWLSLLGFDDGFDYDAVVRAAKSRRISPASPTHSLLLRKATAAIPHGGGRRLTAGDPLYETLRRWIATGAPRTPAGAPPIERIEISPGTRLLAPGGEQQIAVSAYYADGRRADVTHLASFQSNESVIAAVDEHGLVRAGPLPGEAAIMARYRGRFDTLLVTIPLAGAIDAGFWATLPRRNFIDELVWKKLERLGITPSAPTTDATFLRRAHIDIIGKLPAPSETRAFVADDAPEKRERLIDRLLERPEFAEQQANRWVDLLRPNPYRVGIKAVRSLDSWIRTAFREDWPYDRFVRELVTARGGTFRDGAVTVFRDRRSPDELVTLVSQLFLGIRLECAKCHQHPFEVWSQEDFYSLAAYFGDIGRKGTGLSPPISGSEEFVFVQKGAPVLHPRTNAALAPRPLFGSAPPLDAFDDPRAALAAWLVSDSNPFFARVIANRLWAQLMGRGLVEPVDDLRASNPPSNEALLDALAAHFVDSGYDQKALLRAIATSYVYGLASTPNERNVADIRNHSRHYRKRLRAEVLLDAVCDVTQVPERYDAMPAGSRASELWTHRETSIFLDTFGRPDPNQDPPCLRLDEPTVVQALHLMNSPGVHEKIVAGDSLSARLAASERSAEEIVEELYLAVYCRFPTAEERQAAATRVASSGDERRRAVDDLLWALLNTPEFVFED